MLRQLCRGDARNQLWFQIYGIDVKFSQFKFAVITELHFNRSFEMGIYILWGARDRIQDTYFQGNLKVKYID